jgi:uncharacterized protein YidB (DUF937 family)
MGILDSVLGGTPSQSGISAATKALLVVLAAKAAKDYMTQAQGAGPVAGGGLGGILGGLGSMLGAGDGQGGAMGGGLGGLLGGLGGAGGLGALVDQFTHNGHGQAMQSWISNGPNQALAPEQVGQALGEQPLQELEQTTGLPRQNLLQQLAQELPAAMDHVTPNGRLPTEQELAGALQGQGQR